MAELRHPMSTAYDRKGGPTTEDLTVVAARAMLTALQAIETCLRPDDDDAAARLVRAAIAQAEAAGIKAEG